MHIYVVALPIEQFKFLPWGGGVVHSATDGRGHRPPVARLSGKLYTSEETYITHSAAYHNAIMFCMNFTSANFVSADGIAKKRSQ